MMSNMKVYEQYQKIVDWFDGTRGKNLMEKKYLDLILQYIPSNSTILDLGCGTADPIARFFIEKGHTVTGVDGSSDMIALCKKRFPNARWIVSDMLAIDLPETFTVILAWHSFFHLTHDDQRRMFKIIAAHLQTGGIFAFTSGYEFGEVWGMNGGQNLYHASLSTAEYQQQLAEHGFTVLVHKIEDPECGNATVWVAQKW